MSRRSAYTRLRSLAADSRRLCEASTVMAAAVAVIMTQEREKELLVSLHKVLGEVESMKQALFVPGDGSGSETESEDARGEGGDFHCEEGCVRVIVGDLVCILGTESKFVQHSAVNVIVTISEFMAESECDWEIFVSSLGRCLELAMFNTLSCSSASPNSDTQETVCASSSEAVKSTFGNGNLSTVCSIIQVFRKILKSLKQDYEEERVQVYLKCICSWLSHVPWSSICDNHVDLSKGDGHLENNCNMVPGPLIILLLLGNLLQLFCSLADQSHCSEAAKCSELRCQVLGKIQNLVPLLSSWCLRKQRNGRSTPMYHYFKHKLLVLMVRLVADVFIDHSASYTCFELLHEYFEDIMRRKLTLIKEDDSVYPQESPFSHNNSEGGVNNSSQQHLQRLVILLFLKCTVKLITKEAETNERCVCTKTLTLAELGIGCCGARKGFSELYNWLLVQHHPIDTNVDYDTYVEKCIAFASFFVQLFVNEDDMLFQVLLELFNLTSSATQQLQEDEHNLEEMKCDIVFHISNIFNPVLLFHIFLAKLHYDHQILLDYLISKDVGLNCAEYLLRCLRRVTESWKSFIQYSYRKVSHEPNNKKRRLELSEKGRSMAALLWEGGTAYEQAKKCLHSLRVSVESLHQRRLFPYNAVVLLKRLRRFEELCLNEEEQNIMEARK